MYGYGFMSSFRPASTVSMDPDAQAFITAASITDPTQQAAVNQLVVDLKGYSLWTKMKAVYPFVGGSASSHKWNLKDPRDLDAAFRLSFAGGWTHSSTGSKPNGTTGYADTFINQLSVLSQNNTHISYYSRNNVDAIGVDMGVKSPASSYTMIVSRYSGNFVSHVNEFYVFSDNAANTDSRGFFIANRTASNVRNGFKNSSKVYTSSSTSQTQANFKIYLGTLNNEGSPALYSSRECAFASIGDGLSDADATNLNTAVQAFQTSLSRNV